MLDAGDGGAIWGRGWAERDRRSIQLGESNGFYPPGRLWAVVVDQSWNPHTGASQGVLQPCGDIGELLGGSLPLDQVSLPAIEGNGVDYLKDDGLCWAGQFYAFHPGSNQSQNPGGVASGRPQADGDVLPAAAFETKRKLEVHRGLSLIHI